MLKLNLVQYIILSVIVIMGLAVALVLYFQDLPLLWIITLLMLVISIGILGYVLGHLFGSGKS